MPPASESNNSVPTASDIDAAQRTLYAAGLPQRKLVVGPEYVESSLRNASDFSRPMIDLATSNAWGAVWTRPGLPLNTRSLLNLAMLSTLGRLTELGVHVRGAVRNGVTETEIQETLLQVAVYVGMPAGMEAFRVADGVLREMREKGEGRRREGSERGEGPVLSTIDDDARAMPHSTKTHVSIERHNNTFRVERYLRHVAEAKDWIELVLGDELGPQAQFESDLSDGVALARTTQKVTTSRRVKVVNGHHHKWRLSDNIAEFLRLCDEVELPEVFQFELEDLFSRKNLPRVIYCIHAVSFLLARLGWVERPVRDLQGLLKYNKDDVDEAKDRLNAAGVRLPDAPQFQDLGGPPVADEAELSADSPEPVEVEEEPLEIASSPDPESEDESIPSVPSTRSSPEPEPPDPNLEVSVDLPMSWSKWLSQRPSSWSPHSISQRSQSLLDRDHDERWTAFDRWADAAQESLQQEHVASLKLLTKQVSQCEAEVQAQKEKEQYYLANESRVAQVQWKCRQALRTRAARHVDSLASHPPPSDIRRFCYVLNKTSNDESQQDALDSLRQECLAVSEEIDELERLRLDRNQKIGLLAQNKLGGSMRHHDHQEQSRFSTMTSTLRDRLSMQDPNETCAGDQILWRETKQLLLYVIRIQDGHNLLNILTESPTEDHEARWIRLQQAEPVDEPPHQYLSRISYQALKGIVLQNIQTLRHHGFIKARTDYQEFLDEMAQDIRDRVHKQEKIGDEILQRRGELQILNKALEDLREQLELYEQSYSSALSTLQQRRKGKKWLSNPVSHQALHEYRLRKQGTEPQFGSYVYRGNRLVEKGILRSWGGFSGEDRNLREVEVTIASDRVNKYDLEGLWNGTILTGCTASITWDELLRAQSSRKSHLEFFELSDAGALVVNTSEFVALVVKKFWSTT
ncbi:MAG: hypothetical protein M1828_002001 [Chrysothrix sp. TS-e1954]|nr:MAG: hypothetical protein M1828_002001 [Chrysothrix sp. TS-e1954]